MLARLRLIARCLLVLGLGLVASASRAGDLPSPARCDLNATDWAQALCLLTPVKTYGELGSYRQSLPAPWQRLLNDQQALPAAANFRVYLRRRGIEEQDIGGALARPISRNAEGETARYLVIHDTSSLLAQPGTDTFPRFANGPAWSENQLRLLVLKKNAHVFIGRTGHSSTAVDLGEALITTKFEKANRERLEGLFVGVENIQPRLLDRRGIDSIAPAPGFTRAQMQRLAVVYVAASIRAGRWLIPAFHAVLDSGIADAHDDPQHFDLAGFSAVLNRLLSEQGRRAGR